MRFNCYPSAIAKSGFNELEATIGHKIPQGGKDHIRLVGKSAAPGSLFYLKSKLIG